ncbi:hypothetical protein [Ectopseudomonas oleovorans]|nr:hypothetical protein [Pseudomonas oleovorans]
MSDPHSTEVVKSALFYKAVIRYARPFLNSNSSDGKLMYPVRRLKRYEGFDSEMHEHLIDVRNALVAHDDFEELPPRILFHGFSPAGEDYLIPLSVTISNSCLQSADRIEDWMKIHAHVVAAETGALQILHGQIAEARKRALDAPEETKNVAYRKEMGTHSPEDGVRNLDLNDDWLSGIFPSFENVGIQYQYEHNRMNLQFLGPEVIHTPQGKEITITPGATPGAPGEIKISDPSGSDR